MKVYLVWQWEKWEQAEVIEIFLDQGKASDFVHNLEKEPDLYYRVEERKVTE